MKLKITILIFFLLISANIIFGQTNEISSTDDLAEELELNDIIYKLNMYVEAIDLESVSSSLISGEGIDLGSLGKTLLDTVKSNIKPVTKDIIFIIIFLIVAAVIKSLELENDSAITKTINIIVILVIISYLLLTYINILKIMQETIKTEQGIIQIVSPFLMGVLMLTRRNNYY